MGVFNLFSLIGIGTAAIFREGTKHVNSRNNNVLKMEAIKRGDNKYIDKDGILRDVVLDYELKYVDDTPGYSGYFTGVFTSDFVLDCYEHDRFFEIQKEASYLNKKYFVVNVMDYFNRDLYTEDTLFFIVENKPYGAVYKVYRDKKIIKVISLYHKEKGSSLLYSKETFMPTKEWLEGILKDSYIPNDIRRLHTSNYSINGTQLIPRDKFQGLFVLNYSDDINYCIVGYHILGGTYHGYLNRIKIEKIINEYLTNSYDLNEIKNVLSEIVNEEEFYNNHEKNHINEHQEMFKKAIEIMKEDINTINNIISGITNKDCLKDVVNHLANIIS